jgi:hypothetical protein
MWGWGAAVLRRGGGLISVRVRAAHGLGRAHAPVGSAAAPHRVRPRSGGSASAVTLGCIGARFAERPRSPQGAIVVALRSDRDRSDERSPPSVGMATDATGLPCVAG